MRTVSIALLITVLGITWAAVPLSTLSNEVNGVVAKNGLLGTKGNKIVNAHGEEVAFKGMSLFWSQWAPRFWNEKTVEWLIKDWKVELIRAPMAVDQGGYDTNPDVEKAKVITVVDACIKLGIYVLIDWHIGPQAPEQNLAEDFWREMATKYKNVPNVIFETFNEPGPDWGAIKKYHERIVQIIRHEVGASNLMVLGTPNWSQDVDIVADDRVEGDNLAYTLHFYSVVHRQPLRDKANIALSKGLPIFITEWGPCDTRTLDFDEAAIWLKWAQDNKISTANWGVYDKSETCATLNSQASSEGHWSDDDLTEDGKWVKKYLSGDAPGPSPKPPVPGNGCCSWDGHTCQTKVGDYCHNQDHCEHECKGKWVNA